MSTESGGVPAHPGTSGRPGTENKRLRAEKAELAKRVATYAQVIHELERLRHPPARADVLSIGIAVLAIAEFRALWVAELFSVAGDLLARVALAVIVFRADQLCGMDGDHLRADVRPRVPRGILLGPSAITTHAATS